MVLLLLLIGEVLILEVIHNIDGPNTQVPLKTCIILLRNQCSMLVEEKPLQT